MIERCRFELCSICNDYIDLDQFAYREGRNSTMALIKCQHTWLKWLDGNADFVRFKSVFTNRCLFNSNEYFFRRFPSVFFRFRLFILLPCKLLHVCLRNELLIKTFIIIIVIIICSD